MILVPTENADVDRPLSCQPAALVSTGTLLSTDDSHVGWRLAYRPTLPLSTVDNSLVDRQRPCRTTPTCRSFSCRPTTHVSTGNSLVDRRLSCRSTSLVLLFIITPRVGRWLSCLLRTLLSVGDSQTTDDSRVDRRILYVSTENSLVDWRLSCRPTTPCVDR